MINTMRKIYSLFLILSMFFSINVVAQSTDKAEVDAFSKIDQAPEKFTGIRAGWHMASLVENGNLPDTAKNINRFYVGVFFEKKASDLISIGTGIEYFQNGSKYTDNSARVFHTISFPINLKLKLGPFFGIGGVAGNFKVSEKIEIDDNSTSVPSIYKSNYFDIPIYAGAGVKLWIVNVEFRYNWGLLEAKNGFKHRYLQVGLGVYLK